MPIFTYRARNAAGEVITGQYDALNEHDAAQELRNQGMWVTELRAGKSAPESRPRSGDTPPLEDMVLGEGHPKELALLYGQLAAMVGAGMSIRKGLEMTLNGTTGRIHRAMPEALRKAEDGEPLHVALAHRPILFGKVALALIRAGEASGNLEAMLCRCAAHFERILKWKQSARKAMVYPVILLLSSIFIPSVVTLVLQGPQAWVRATLLPLIREIVVLILAYVAFRVALYRFKSLGYAWDRLMISLPVLGKNRRKSTSARFVRTFADLYDAGTGPRIALEVAAETCGNRVIEQSVLRAQPGIEAGEALSTAFGSTGALPTVALQMLATGEMSGTVAESLDKVADFLEGDVETSTASWMQALPVILWAIIAIPMILQIFQMWGAYGQAATNISP